MNRKTALCYSQTSHVIIQTSRPLSKHHQPQLLPVATSLLCYQLQTFFTLAVVTYLSMFYLCPSHL